MEGCLRLAEICRLPTGSARQWFEPLETPGLHCRLLVSSPEMNDLLSLNLSFLICSVGFFKNCYKTSIMSNLPFSIFLDVPFSGMKYIHIVV